MGFSDDVIKLNPKLMEGKAPARNPSKYHNVRTEAAGMVFSSGREAAGVGDLIILEEQKRIFGLRLQVRFPWLEISPMWPTPSTLKSLTAC